MLLSFFISFTLFFFITLGLITFKILPFLLTLLYLLTLVLVVTYTYTFGLGFYMFLLLTFYYGELLFLLTFTNVLEALLRQFFYLGSHIVCDTIFFFILSYIYMRAVLSGG